MGERSRGGRGEKREVGGRDMREEAGGRRGGNAAHPILHSVEARMNIQCIQCSTCLTVPPTSI